MANYKELYNGSRGEDVKKLQQTLVNAGYSVGASGVDGVYGSDTASAVRKYQSDKGLKIDGIAGSETQGSLYGSTGQVGQPQVQQGAAAPAVTAAPTAQETQKQYAYDPALDKAYMEALTALQQAQQQTPVYKDSYSQQLQQLYGEITGRKPFSYDINGDALYQQAKENYVQQGRMAMLDTVGQAAALTGGYGSSYAQNVGQQAYNRHLQGLNDIVPELYAQALDAYTREGDALLQEYGLLESMANTEYDRYQDDVTRYLQQLELLKQQADDAYDRGSENWYADYQNRYQAERDAVADAQWQTEFDEAKRQYDQEWAQYLAAQAAKNSSGGGGGYSAVDRSGYTVTNDNGDGRVKIAGHGLVQKSNLPALINMGNVREVYDDKEETVTYEWVEGTEVGDDYDVENTTNGEIVAIPGHGWFNYEELKNLIYQGKVRQVYDHGARTVKFVWAG